MSSNSLAALKEKIVKNCIRYGVGVSHSGGNMRWTLDIRSLFLDAETLNLIAEIFWKKYESYYPFQVGGQEISSIPFITAVVLKGNALGKPVNGFVIRKIRKKSGLQKQIEGDLNELPIILIDDLINSGETILRQLKILEEQNKNVTRIFVLANIREDRRDTPISFLHDRGIKLDYLYSPDDLGIEKNSNKNSIDRESFVLNWHFKAGKANFFYDEPRANPILHEKKLYIGNDDGIFRALDPSSGKLIWWFRVHRRPLRTRTFSSPLILNDSIIFGAGDGNVYSLHKRTGKKQWINFMGNWIESAPVYSKKANCVFIAMQVGLFRKKSMLIALEPTGGKLKWQYTIDADTRSPILLYKKLAIVGDQQGNVHAVLQNSGAIKWHTSLDGEIIDTFLYDPHHKQIIVGTKNGLLYGLHPEKGTIHWSQDLRGTLVTEPIIQDDKILLTAEKKLIAVSSNSGDILWTVHFPTKILSAPQEVNGSVFFGSSGGGFYGVDLNRRTLSRFQTTDQIASKTVYDPDTKSFFVVTTNNSILSLSLKENLANAKNQE